MSSDDKLTLGVILALIIGGAIAVVAMAVSDTVVKTACFDNGGSWNNGSCTIDNNNQ